MLKVNLYLATPLLASALLLLQNRIFPAAIFLVLLGFVIAWLEGTLPLSALTVTLNLPSFHTFSLDEVIYGLIYAGIIQIFLTLTNAVVATVALVHDLFPNQIDVSTHDLIVNMGLMNITTPFIGGMPLCHGARGLAAQYLFETRTGGVLIIEGSLEILFDLFFAQSILTIFTSFPLPIICSHALFGSD